MRRGLQLACGLCVAVLVAAMAPTARGTDRTWQVSSGSWQTAGNWTGFAVPGGGDNALVNNGGTCTIGPAISAPILTLYAGFGATDVGSYLQTGGSLSSAAESIGHAGLGSFTQTGGSNSASIALYMGVVAGGSGSYNLSGGTVSAVGEYVGYSGSGSFTQTSGVHSVTGSGGLVLGNSANSFGSYNLSGGSLSTANEYIGNSGSGSFTQTNGGHTVAGALVFGNSATSFGQLQAVKWVAQCHLGIHRANGYRKLYSIIRHEFDHERP